MPQGRRSTRRDEQARRTRLEVIGAAHRLFVDRGYAATSIRSVAEEAAVSDQTVYRVFGDKPGLLRAVVLEALGGEGNIEPLRTGTRMEALAEVRTAGERLRVVAGWVGEAYGRGLAQLEQVVVTAAPADERIGELARFMSEQRYEDTRSVALAIMGDVELPAGISPAAMADYLYAVESSPVYLVLTTERGWTTEQYVDWFVRMVECLFLADLRPPADGHAPAVTEGHGREPRSR